MNLNWSWRELVLGILAVLAVNWWVIDRNFVKRNEIQYYINYSKPIKLFIPADLKTNKESYYSWINLRHIELSKEPTIYRTIFYSSEQQKYLMIISFCGFDRIKAFPFDKCHDRDEIIRSGGYFRVRANQTQWYDPHYGTAENPMPVFGFELITTLNGSTEQQQVIEQKKAQYDVADEVNYLFVQQYLTHFVSEEELKKLFAQKR